MRAAPQVRRPGCASGISFYRETFARVWPQVGHLLSLHKDEIAHYQDIALDPDAETYAKADHLGLLRVFTARLDVDSSLVGYGVFFVKANLHYRRSLQAQEDVLFILKGERGFGRHFIAWCDEELRSEGVQVVMRHVKAAHNFGKLLERMNYELVDLMYARRLDR